MNIKTRLKYLCKYKQCIALTIYLWKAYKIDCGLLVFDEDLAVIEALLYKKHKLIGEYKN